MRSAQKAIESQGALPVLMSAVLDALRPQGVECLDIPATPYRVWRAIREVRS